MKRLLTVVLMIALLVACGCAAAQEPGRIVCKYEEMIIPIGEYRTAQCEFTPASLKYGGVTYEISDESVATVNVRNGRVTGVAVGECTLTLTSVTDPSVKTVVPVQVVKPVTKILANYTKTMAAGTTLQLTYTIKPEDATLQGANFTSSKASVATVDENGLITAHASGTTKIVVTSQDGEARHSFKITVEQLPQEIKFRKPEYTVAVGKTLKFNTTVLPKNSSNKNRLYSSSDESIATINREGLLKAHAPGDVVISATSVADPNVVGSVTVHCVQPIKAISFEKTLFDLGVGDTAQLTTVLTPENATASAVVYQSLNPNVCTVDQSGLVTALGGGESTIVAYSAENEKRRATATIRVNVPLEGISVEQQALRLEIGTHAFPNIKVKPLDATNRTMTWFSSDENIAVVTNNSIKARIVGKGWGTCELTGIAQDGGYTAKLTVYVGALYEAITAKSAAEENGQMTAVLTNHSDMHMKAVTFAVRGTDASGKLVTTEVVAAVDIAPGAESGPVVIPADKSALKNVEIAVAGWETDTGFYTNSNEVKYSYRIAGGLQLWRTVK